MARRGSERLSLPRPASRASTTLGGVGVCGGHSGRRSSASDRARRRLYVYTSTLFAMIFGTPRPTPALADRLAEFDELRERLGVEAGNAGPLAWQPASSNGARRPRRARSRSRDFMSRRPTWRRWRRAASVCLIPTMTTVWRCRAIPARWTAVRRDVRRSGLRVGRPRHPRFAFRCLLLPGKNKEPGQYRRRGIDVTRPGGGPPAHDGPPFESVPGLMREVVEWLGHGDIDAHVAVRAAMAHLHLVSVHPFRDGNGRVARIVQSLVLAREGLLAPKYILDGGVPRLQRAGRIARRCKRLRVVALQPERDPGPSVDILRRRLISSRLRNDSISSPRPVLDGQCSRTWWRSEGGAAGLVTALEQSMFNGVDRASYIF